MPWRAALVSEITPNPPNTTHMNHLSRHILHTGQPALEPRRHSPNQKSFLIALAGIVAVFACASCSETRPPAPPLVPITDTQPVGDGLKVIGFAMLGAACVVVLGRLIR